MEIQMPTIIPPEKAKEIAEAFIAASERGEDISLIRIPSLRTPDKAAKIVGIPPERLRAFCKEGKIKFIPCGNKILINIDKLIDSINEGFSFDAPAAENKYGITPIKL